MVRYLVNPTGSPKADAFLERMAVKGEAMTAADAERLFDREWWRIEAKRREAPGSTPDADYAAVLVGLAAMRSCARVEKETGTR